MEFPYRGHNNYRHKYKPKPISYISFLRYLRWHGWKLDIDSSKLLTTDIILVPTPVGWIGSVPPVPIVLYKKRPNYKATIAAVWRAIQKEGLPMWEEPSRFTGLSATSMLKEMISIYIKETEYAA